MRQALVRGVSSRLDCGERTYAPSTPIDFDRAVRQHRLYIETLRDLGCRVHELPPDPALPDSVFVEDTAVIVDEVAVITRPGAPSRRPEVPAIAAFLKPRVPTAQVVAPGTLDGGDVLRVGRTAYVGSSGRTNSEGIAQFRALLAPHGYRVVPVSVSGCLHLKSAVTEVAERLLLIEKRWVDADAFDDCELIEVDPRESGAANALRVGDDVIYPAAFPRTAARLRERGLRVDSIDLSELAKAEGAVTCCSLLWSE